MSNKQKKVFLVLLMISQFALAIPVLAVGVGVRPSFLDLELSVGQVHISKIIVYNISQEAAIFKVYPDELANWITVEPADFRLEASENKEIKIVIKANVEGRHATNLSVVASPLDKRLFNADSGIKVPVRLDVRAGAGGFFSNFYIFMALWLGFSVILICLVIFIVIKLRRKTWKARIIDKAEGLIHHKKHWWE